MEVGQPSRTAESTGVMRALHQALPPEARILNDPIAPRLVSPDSEPYRSRAALVASLSDSVRSRFTHFVYRSRYAEDCLEQAVQTRGISQYVILGAGLDTFAYRQPPWAASLRIFEVDHPATQRWKRARLAEAGIGIPDNVRFVPIDFRDMTLTDGLRQAGLSFSQATSVTMLGVSQYLTEDALDRTFAFVLTMSPSSEIVLTINPPQDMLPPDDAAFYAALTERFAANGEPWLTRLVPDQLTGRLRRMGFSSAICLSPAEAQARYFRNRSDGLQAPEIELMVRATV